MNRTDPRVTRTLQKIDSSLLENLDTCAFSKITVEMLCRRAGINRSTFYKYYKDKETLLDSYLNRIAEDFAQSNAATGFMIESPHTISKQEFISSLSNTIDRIYTHRHIYKILWKPSTGRSIFQDMKDIICRNVLDSLRESSDGTLRSSPYHELYARLYTVNLMTLMRWWLEHEPSISRNDVQVILESGMKERLFSPLP